jgi:hypothetical protein
MIYVIYIVALFIIVFTWISYQKSLKEAYIPSFRVRPHKLTPSILTYNIQKFPWSFKTFKHVIELFDRHSIILLQECYDETETLNVHHKLYRKDANPWDYELEELICLCEKCHQYIHQQKKRLDSALSNQQTWVLDYLVGYAEAQELDGPYAKIHISSSDMAQGVADVYGITLNDVIDVCVDRYVTHDDLFKKRSK